jgi:hypothetical protein
MPSGPREPSPAVAAFLLNDCKYSQRVFSRCLRDLADAGVVRFETHPSGAVTVSAAGPAPGLALREYERVALARLSARAGLGTSVPLSALVSDDGASSDHFRERFTDELGTQAGAAGLARRSSGRGTWPAVLALLASWVCAAIVVAGINQQAALLIFAAGSVTSFTSLLVALARRRWRPTPEGAAAASRWRQHQAIAEPAGPQRHGADAARPATSDTLAMSSAENAPLPRGRVWSSFGGQWHVVKAGPVYQPDTWPTLRTLRSLVFLTVLGTVFFAFFGIIVLAVADSPESQFHVSTATVVLLMCAPAVLGLIVITACWQPAYRRQMALPTSHAFADEVVKRWSADAEGSNLSGYYLSIDDGSGPTAVTFSVEGNMYSNIGLGDKVRVTLNPRLGLLKNIEATATATHGPYPP